MLENFVVTWYSRVIFNNRNKDNKIIFRRLETDFKKITTTEMQLKFNKYLCVDGGFRMHVLRELNESAILKEKNEWQ